MRDTDRLRRRLETALALVPALALAGCDSGPSPASPSSDPAHGAQIAKTEAPSTTRGEPLAPAPASATPAAPTPAPPRTRFDPIAGDPPFVDGYNPEEATCPSGNWCGTPDAVKPFAVATTAETMSCADRIGGGGWKDAKSSDPAYQGLSRSPAMLGSFNEGRTVRRRAQGDKDVCCYHWFEYCSGRPILEGAHARTADSRPGPGWTDGGDLAPCSSETLASAWVADGLAEHAAIASFARATLELLAVGAPADLVGRTQQAGLDEVRHAQLCFTLAARYGGQRVEPGRLAPPALREASLTRLAMDCFDEGCVGETIAALQAQRALTSCRDPQVSAALEIIANDEADHAALAWATVRWCLDHGGPDVARALAAHTASRGSALRSEPEDTDISLAAHGRLDPRARVAAANDAWRDIIGPMARELLRGARSG